MWKEQRPLTRSEIIELTKDKTWKASSIHILLNQLLDKNAIEVGEIVKTGKSYGRTYITPVTKNEYEVMQLQNSFKKINPSKSSIIHFFSSLIESENVKEETLKDLEKLLKDNKES